ncbi:MAG TPA: urea ABC transporter permease subunit UrtB [Dehalococcoidales bacterium]
MVTILGILRILHLWVNIFQVKIMLTFPAPGRTRNNTLPAFAPRIFPLRKSVSALLLPLAMVCIFLLGAYDQADAQGQKDATGRSDVLAEICSPKTEEQIRAIGVLVHIASDGSEQDLAWSSRIIERTLNRGLGCGPESKYVLIDDQNYFDAATFQPVSKPSFELSFPSLTFRVRAHLETASAELTLLVKSTPEIQESVVQTIEKNFKIADKQIIERAMKLDYNSAVLSSLKAILSLLELHSDSVDKRLAAIKRVGTEPNRRTQTALLELLKDNEYSSDPRIKTALQSSLRKVDIWLKFSNILAVAFSGLSYASILFLAALGLAIIFGLMGVINLAQGELIMLGAYCTFLVQAFFKTYFPSLLGWYLPAAVPVTFLATAAIGIMMELTVIRFLYKRPIMTLLATWAVSLLIINSVRVIFGTQNLEFVALSYLSGGVSVIGDFMITFNRLFAIIFALVALVLTSLLLHKTKFGLYIRAVTNNREMARCIGVSTRMVDSLAFGFGSGLAGLGGLALSQIFIANPNMGQDFIVDSFLTVVLGGVGNLGGTTAASLTIGEINLFIEPIWGAVAAKVIVLLLFIFFIQWRPEGMFTPKGRR